MKFPETIGCWTLKDYSEKEAIYTNGQYLAGLSSNRLTVGTIRPVGVGFLNKETNSLEESIEILSRITDAKSARKEQ